VMVARGHSIQRCCRILDAPESSFCAQRRRVPSARSVRHAWLTDVIDQVHSDARGVYGAVTVHAQLTKGLGIKVSHGTVALLMERANIQGITGRRKHHYVPPQATAKDLVDRQFSRDLPNHLWVTDITEHPTTCIPVVVARPDLRRLAVVGVTETRVFSKAGSWRHGSSSGITCRSEPRCWLSMDSSCGSVDSVRATSPLHR